MFNLFLHHNNRTNPLTQQFSFVIDSDESEQEVSAIYMRGKTFVARQSMYVLCVHIDDRVVVKQCCGNSFDRCIGHL